jgi:predicted small metal-binding protein
MYRKVHTIVNPVIVVIISSQLMSSRKILTILNTTKCIMKKRTLLCHEVGLGSNNKDCSYQITGNREEEFFRKIIDHAQEEHDLRPEDLTPQLEEQIRSLVRSKSKE